MKLGVFKINILMGLGLMMRKITKLRTLSYWMDDPMVGHVSSANLQESLGKKFNTLVWCLPKTLQYLS